MTHPLEAAVGRRYGPVSTEAGRGSVADLVAVTGDDPDRWTDTAPPSFAAAALFKVAPTFLSDDDVVPFTRSLIHTEQRFTWHGPLAVGAQLTVTGDITAVRARGPMTFVTFDLTADTEGGRWLDGTATFLMSDAAATEAEEEVEPSQDARGVNDVPSALELPPASAEVIAMAKSASRADLVRYAGATGDWNPIHWDHEAARGAGLPGVIVHGLLMAAWAAQSASRYGVGDAPLRSLRLRFRRPLRPAVQAEVAGTVTAVEDDGADLSLTVGAGGDTLVQATARVTR